MNPAGLDIKTLPMRSSAIPRDRIAKRSGHAGEAIRDHLPKMAALPNSANTDLQKWVQPLPILF